MLEHYEPVYNSDTFECLYIASILNSIGLFCCHLVCLGVWSCQQTGMCIYDRLYCRPHLC